MPFCNPTICWPKTWMEYFRWFFFLCHCTVNFRGLDSTMSCYKMEIVRWLQRRRYQGSKEAGQEQKIIERVGSSFTVICWMNWMCHHTSTCKVTTKLPNRYCNSQMKHELFLHAHECIIHTCPAFWQLLYTVKALCCKACKTGRYFLKYIIVWT